MKKRSTLIFGLLAAVLAFSMVLAGCDDPNGSEDTGGYTVTFKIVNSSTSVPITKIEFLDDNEYIDGVAAVRGTITEGLAANTTKEYPIGGFIKEAGQINVAVKVYFGADQTDDADYSFQDEEEKADPKKRFTFNGSSLSRESTY